MTTNMTDVKELKKVLETQLSKVEGLFEKAVEDGRKWFDKSRNAEVLEKLTKVRESLQAKMGVDYNKVYEALNIASRDEVEALNKKLAALGKKLEKLPKAAKGTKAAKATKEGGEV